MSENSARMTFKEKLEAWIGTHTDISVTTKDRHNARPCSHLVEEASRLHEEEVAAIKRPYKGCCIDYLPHAGSCGPIEGFTDCLCGCDPAAEQWCYAEAVLSAQALRQENERLREALQKIAGTITIPCGGMERGQILDIAREALS